MTWRSAVNWLVLLYTIGGVATYFVWLLWDTHQRTKARVYWYPGAGLAGCLLMLTWPLLAVAFFRTKFREYLARQRRDT